VKVGYLGPEGSFSHQAAIIFGQKMQNLFENVELTAFTTLRRAFTALKNGGVTLIIAATESNVEGFVGETLDLLLEHEQAEVIETTDLSIKFTAFKRADVTVDKADFTPSKVRAHSHALGQCRRFIEEYNLQEISMSSNSAAVNALGSDDVALAPAQFSTLADGEVEIFLSNVQDFDNATTQFALIGMQDSATHNKWREYFEVQEKTSENVTNKRRYIYAFTPESDEPGTLLHILEQFYAEKVNITSLFSRPIKGRNNRYTFFITAEGVYAPASVNENYRLIGTFTS
jgi:prephenate dehydratase